MAYFSRLNISFALGAVMLAGCVGSSLQTIDDLQHNHPIVEVANVTSPDARIEFSVTTIDGEPRYAIHRDGLPIVETSKLGLRFGEGPSLDGGFVLSVIETDSKDETWEQPWGERRYVRDRHNELLVRFSSDGEPRESFDLRVRVFDDGAGFRYEVPDIGSRAIIDELTEFSVDGDATAWWTPAGEFNRLEYTYRTTPVSDALRANTPFTLRREDGTHIAIHEAALVDYAGMWLDQRRSGVLEVDLAPRADGTKVQVDGAFKTPWRVIQIEDDAAGLYNGSDIYLNLNEPNKLGDVSYFEPGKYIGIWWGMHINTYTWGSGPKHGATTENTKKYIDFAAEHGFNGVLVEGWNIGWDGDWFFNGELFSFTEAYPDYDFEALSDYAAEKGTALIGHHETSGNLTNYENQLDDAMDLMAERGVSVIKTGYVADGSDLKYTDADGTPRYTWHDSQERVIHDIKVLEAAHKRGIAINAHEPARATGLRRTYPNAVSREGARGMEFNAWGTPPNTVEHQAILPYTRMLAGPFDFTPGIFNLMPHGHEDVNRVPSTLAKQLALYVTIYSPVQMAADLPQNYARNWGAFQFIKDVPADWEHSIALQGEVGDHFVIVRKDRNSEDWYLGGVTDEARRTVSIPLDFLSEGKRYIAEIYRDGPSADWKENPYPITIERRSVSLNDTLVIPMAPGGGFAVRFAANSSNAQLDEQGTKVLSKWADLPISAEQELSGGTLLTAFVPTAIDGLTAREVFIWLPSDYQEGSDRFPVLYMHDGQHLFQPGAGITGDEWRVDETMARLISERKIEPAIVVGISNTENRWQEYAPAAFIENLPEDLRDALIAELGGAPVSDDYLRMVVEVIKPMIDRSLRTKTDRANTLIAGSSMGGLISLYAVSEYPDIFAAAAGLSTHWPLYDPTTADEAAVLTAITTSLDLGGLNPERHRLWLDHGTENLDSYYAPYQSGIDKYLASKGFGADNYKTKVYFGSDHNEASWAANLEDPLVYLLGRKRAAK